LVNIAALITPVAVAGSASLGWPREATVLTRRAALAATAAFVIAPGAAFASRQVPPAYSWPAVCARFMAVGRAFNLSSEEVAAALADEDALIDTLCELFKQHGVSLTWVLTGTGPMVHDLRDDRP